MSKEVVEAKVMMQSSRRMDHKNSGQIYESSPLLFLLPIGLAQMDPVA